MPCFKLTVVVGYWCLISTKKVFWTKTLCIQMTVQPLDWEFFPGRRNSTQSRRLQRPRRTQEATHLRYTTTVILLYSPQFEFFTLIENAHSPPFSTTAGLMIMLGPTTWFSVEFRQAGSEPLRGMNSVPGALVDEYTTMSTFSVDET